jgi:hypothetical protein
MTHYAVGGMGLWTPGYANLDAWRQGARDDSITVAAASLAPARSRRATSHLTRMLVDTAGQATDEAGLSPSEIATVFGSAHGEIQIAIEQLQMMREGDGKVSPARFKNSVHNTAAGLFSLAAKNHGFTTAIAGGDDTVAMCLLEAQGLLEAGEPAVVVAVGEEALPEPIHRFAPHAELGLAFALRKDEQAGPRIGPLERAAHVDSPDVPGPFQGHPAAGALALLEGILHARPGRYPLGPRGGDGGWCIDLEVPS